MGDKKERQTNPQLDELWGEETTSNTNIRVFKPGRAKSPPRLHQTSGPGSPREFELDVQRLVIGRSSSADVTIDSPELSRQHVALEREGDSFKCTDLDSLHGLFLNGVRVYSCVLRPGDTIQVGRCTFLFQGGV